MNTTAAATAASQMFAVVIDGHTRAEGTFVLSHHVTRELAIAACNRENDANPHIMWARRVHVEYPVAA